MAYYYVGEARRFTAETVIEAYCRGYYPMGEDDGSLHWITSDPRFVLTIGALHVPKSLERLVRRRPFEIRVDTAFRRVMEQCARPRSETNLAWITPRMIDVYCELHAAGVAHSVEAWRGGVLVGGLYGVSLGAAFFGESMFTRADLGGGGASKVCLVELDRLLHEKGFRLLDSQEANPHMAQFGGETIDLERYLERLELALENPPKW